jgi:hypothetical protein
MVGIVYELMKVVNYLQDPGKNRRLEMFTIIAPIMTGSLQKALDDPCFSMLLTASNIP